MGAQAQTQEQRRHLKAVDSGDLPVLPEVKKLDLELVKNKAQAERELKAWTEDAAERFVEIVFQIEEIKRHVQDLKLLPGLRKQVQKLESAITQITDQVGAKGEDVYDRFLFLVLLSQVKRTGKTQKSIEDSLQAAVEAGRMKTVSTSKAKESKYGFLFCSAGYIMTLYDCEVFTPAQQRLKAAFEGARARYFKVRQQREREETKEMKERGLGNLTGLTKEEEKPGLYFVSIPPKSLTKTTRMSSEGALLVRLDKNRVLSVTQSTGLCRYLRVNMKIHIDLVHNKGPWKKPTDRTPGDKLAHLVRQATKRQQEA